MFQPKHDLIQVANLKQKTMSRYTTNVQYILRKRVFALPFLSKGNNVNNSGENKLLIFYLSKWILIRGAAVGTSPTAVFKSSRVLTSPICKQTGVVERPQEATSAHKGPDLTPLRLGDWIRETSSAPWMHTGIHGQRTNTKVIFKVKLIENHYSRKEGG